MTPIAFSDLRPQVGQGSQELLALLANQRSNTAPGNILASAVRTTTNVAASGTNYGMKGMVAFLSITAASGTGGIRVDLRGSAKSFGTYLSFATPLMTGLVATGDFTFLWYPGIAQENITGANYGTYKYSVVVMPFWQIVLSHADASNYTYSLDYGILA